MRYWSDFLPDVSQYATGVPQIVAEHAIKRAAQDFCRQTRAWQMDLDPTLTVAGVADYDLELEPQSELVRLESARFGTNPCGVPIVPRDDRRNYSSCIYYSVSDKTVTLKPAASATGLQLIVRASLMPSNDADGIEDGIFDTYVETIARKAGATLCAQASRGWSNPGVAAMQMTMYQAEVDKIKTRLWKGSSSSMPRGRGLYF